MRNISPGQVLELHRRIMETSGGVPIILNLGALESAVQRPRMTFGGKDLYITLAFSIIRNHPFLDGNKRTGHAAMEVFLVLNGHELKASVDDAEEVILRVASGAME